ncbi:hypothetical protein ACFQBQ_07665 [Granulicella cerasi]|uniref:Uncharacterized protein n=1 Tax=Granulicella cerasi TaxID=741063 RepID=A0ABW1Z7P5_9BACT|nr:hypothetical protein [Granulicella cerasi]
MKKTLMGLLACGVTALAGAVSAMAQDNVQPASQDVAKLYAVGGSYSPGASPAFAGTAMVAIKIPNTSTYGVTIYDALPTSVKPFKITTNIGAGVAQKLTTIAGYDVFGTTSAGLTYTSTNTGWNATFGGAVMIPIKTLKDGSKLYLMPEGRGMKSSVSDGSGVQVIVGVQFALGTY